MPATNGRMVTIERAIVARLGVNEVEGTRRTRVLAITRVASVHRSR
jgi:hypothetical protein